MGTTVRQRAMGRTTIPTHFEWGRRLVWGWLWVSPSQSAWETVLASQFELALGSWSVLA